MAEGGRAVQSWRLPWTAAMRPGGQVGRYVLVREVARGGMGVVFEARGADGARVALKLLTNVPP